MSDAEAECTSSSTSITNKKLTCSHCKMEIVFRNLFHHIRIKHPQQFIEDVVSHWDDTTVEGSPLRVCYNQQTMYACLSTDKCFNTDVRAYAHFKKNPKDLKEHNKQLKKLMKEKDNKDKREAQDLEKRRRENPERVKKEEGMKSGDPLFIESLWRGMAHWKRGCDLAVSIGQKAFGPEFPFASNTKKNTTRPWKEVFDQYVVVCSKAKRLLEDNSTDIKTLRKFYNYFFFFLWDWRDNIKSIRELDSRLDESSPDCIVKSRQSDLDEEFYFLATYDMPIPTPSSFDLHVQTEEHPIQEEKQSVAEPKKTILIPGMTEGQSQHFLQNFPIGSPQFNELMKILQNHVV